MGSRSKGKSKTIDAGTTTGTVRPMPASAEPIAGFMLLCRRFARVPRTAAHVWGNSTSVAMTIPTPLEREAC